MGFPRLVCRHRSGAPGTPFEEIELDADLSGIPAGYRLISPASILSSEFAT